MAGQLDLALGPPRATTSAALTVTELVRLVRDALDARFGDCWVTGEISNARFANYNHFYFTLKDADAAINVVMFSTAKRRLRFKPADGMKVVVRGRVNIYETRGTLQFYAEEMEPRGVGSLQIAFEQLKKRLSEEGLFEPARKRALPFLPRTVGIVTALGGAGLRDILRVLLDRFPNLHVIVRPARVQGEGAANEIAEAIEDFVADKRAPTPTFAAHMVVPSRIELRDQIKVLERSLTSSMRKNLDDLAEDIDYLSARVKHPRVLMRAARERADETAVELADAMAARVADARRQLREYASRLRPPSAAAREVRIRTRELSTMLAHTMTSRTRHLRTSLEHASSSLIRGANIAVDDRRKRLASLATQLDATSPLRCLDRGYSVAIDLRLGRAVMDANSVE